MDVLRVEGGELARLCAGEAEPDEAVAASFVHVGLKGLHLPVDAMLAAAGPGAQVQLEVRIASGDDQRLSRLQPAQGAVDQQVPAPVEADITQGDFWQRGGGRRHGWYPVPVSLPSQP